MPKPWEEYAAADESPKPWEEYATAPAREGPSIGPARPQGFSLASPQTLIDAARDYVANLASERRTGRAERAEAEAAGIGVTPTTGQMIAGAGIIAAPELAATAGIPATLASVLSGHFGSEVLGTLGERGVEAAVPGAGSLGREGGEVIGGIGGGIAGGAVPGAVRGLGRAATTSAARAPIAAARPVAKGPPLTANPLVQELGNLLLDVAPAPVRMGVRYLGKARSLAKAAQASRGVEVPPVDLPTGASASGGYSFAGVPNLSSVATPKIAPATTRAALEAIPEAGGGELAAVLARKPQLAAQAVERPLNPAWSTPEAPTAGGVEVKPGVWKVPPEVESPIAGGTKASTARLSPEELAEYRGGIEPVQVFEKGAPNEAIEMMTIAAKSGAEPGSKAWFVLEEGGPKYVTSNKAAAAKRAGKQTTWVEVPRLPTTSPAAGFKPPTETGAFLEGSVQLRRALGQGAKPGPQLVKPAFGTRESSEALALRLGGEALETPRPYVEFPKQPTYGLPPFTPAVPFTSPLQSPALLEQTAFLARMLGQ